MNQKAQLSAALHMPTASDVVVITERIADHGKQNTVRPFLSVLDAFQIGLALRGWGFAESQAPAWSRSRVFVGGYKGNLQA